MNDTSELTLFEASARFREGNLTGDESLDHVLRCIRQTEPKIEAWQYVPDRKALEKQWNELEGKCSSLNLLRIPVAIKDTIDVAMMPTERGSTIYSGRIPTENATCVQQLIKNGIFPVGKTVTTEFAYFTPGKTKNPHNVLHTPGGSSSGSAAVVSARVVPVALGSQTAASVIRPAAYCGVVGYVATPGLVSMRGILPLALSFDSLGIIAKTADDVGFVMNSLQSRQLSRKINCIKPIAVLAVDGETFGNVDNEMSSAFDTALESLSSVGVIVKRETMAGCGHWSQLHMDILAFEASRNFCHEYDNYREQLSDEFKSLIESGRALSMEDRFDMFIARLKAIKHFENLLDKYDVIVSPAATGAAPVGLTSTGDPAMSRPWQLIGSCQCTLPFAQNSNDMPLGLQIIGRRYHDNTLLSIAKWIQEEFSWQAPIPKFKNAEL
jgi:Asp-tRNA(Asn)/Glu-tRNA(Gln) amidotransferase A subunit family amidase